MTEERKESRTEKLLRILQVPDDFKDPTLPNGLFSHSQYNSWLICGKAYEFKYVIKYATPEYVATSNGSAVHSGIEHALLGKMAGKIPTIEEGLELISKIIDEKSKLIVDWGVGGDDAMDAAKLKTKAQRLYRAFYMNALNKINPVAIEKGFAKRLGDVPVIGYIDLVDEQPALVVPGMTPEEAATAPVKQVVVDFKTSRAKWSKAQLDTNTQLTMYAFVEGTPHVRVDQLVDLKGGPVYHRGESTRNAIDAEVFVDHLNQVADFVRKGVFPMTDIGSWACNVDHCSFWALCRGKKR
jgi:hypothetical protein